MTTEFISNASIPNSTATATATAAATATTLDYHSPIGITLLISLVALFLICSFIIFSQHCSLNHRSQPTATPVLSASAAALPLPGLDEAAVASLSLASSKGGRSGDGCAVCLAEYVGEEMVKVIPGCRHGFHPACIDKWLLSRGSCPVCRCSDIWGRWREEVFVGVRNAGNLRRCKSCDRCCLEVEESGDGGAISLRRICSV